MCDRASYMKMTRRTNLMQQLWFIIISSLYMFRTSICPSSGIFFVYRVVYCCMWCSALGVVAVVLRSRCVVLCTVCEFVSDWQSDTNSHTAVRSPPAYCMAAYRGWRYQRLWWYNLSSWGWAACCSKHVEDRSVTYILLKNNRIVH